MYLGHSTTTDAAAVAVTVDAKLKRLEDWIQARDITRRWLVVHVIVKAVKVVKVIV